MKELEKAKNREKEKYLIGDLDLSHIRNRNEVRVIAMIPEVLRQFPEFMPDSLDLEDIYALTLNKLPARYVQRGSIVLREEVSNELIQEKVVEAIRIVFENPKHNLAS